MNGYTQPNQTQMTMQPVQTGRLGVALKAIAIVVFIGLIGFAIWLGYTETEKFMHNNAVIGCLQAGREDTGKYTIPENYWYNYCMKQQGYSASLN